MSDSNRKKRLRLCRDCETKLPERNPYSRRCVRCAGKNRERNQRRFDLVPWTPEHPIGRPPKCILTNPSDYDDSEPAP